MPPDSVVSSAVIPLKQLLEDCSSSSTLIKKLVHASLEQTVKRILELLPHLIRNQGTSETLLTFLHTAFLVLQQQLGPEFTQNAVQEMLHVYTRLVSILNFEQNFHNLEIFKLKLEIFILKLLNGHFSKIMI